jgi:hypothetical protein
MLKMDFGCATITRPKLAPGTVGKIGIIQLQSQHIFPIDSQTHRVGCFSVRQILSELEERHLSQPP